VLDGIRRVVASPGVPPRDAVLSAAAQRGIPVVSEVALGLELLGPGVRVAAFTGTNGKTTAVDMLRSILEESGVPYAVAGNSWAALTGRLSEAREAGNLVLEVSSFQLHYLREPGFAVAALLNVRPDHLNWHASFEEYAEDKLRVFEGQRAGDLAIVSAADTVGRSAIRSRPAGAVAVGEGGTGLWSGALYLRGRQLLEVEELSFTGVHNHENALFAAAAAERLGAGDEGIREGLRAYRTMPHRMEVVAERDRVLYVDDSKATNPAAVAAALAGLDRPVVLILGGSEKDTDFCEVAAQLGRCRAVICQGEAGPRICEYLSGREAGVPVSLSGQLEEAVETARGLACPGDAVLLSPGCASFDQFSGYSERGRAFGALAVRSGRTVGARGGDGT
jgi:UDP-N-acetylmuramoylalanine--D-glutamate ligase